MLDCESLGTGEVSQRALHLWLALGGGGVDSEVTKLVLINLGESLSNSSPSLHSVIQESRAAKARTCDTPTFPSVSTCQGFLSVTEDPGTENSVPPTTLPLVFCHMEHRVSRPLPPFF